MEKLEKNWHLVVIVLALLVWAVIAVITAHRLYQLRDQAIAPTAPRPAPAAEDSCVLEFAITECFPASSVSACGDLGCAWNERKNTLTYNPDPPCCTLYSCYSRCEYDPDCSALTPTPTLTATPTITPTPTPTPTGTVLPTSTPTATPTPVGECNEAALFSESWVRISPADNFVVGDRLYLAVQGSTNDPQGITNARFRVKIGNGDWSDWMETQNFANGWYRYLYDLSAAGLYTIEAELFNPNLGWF